jgi:hypothetical protein
VLAVGAVAVGAVLERAVEVPAAAFVLAAVD